MGHHHSHEPVVVPAATRRLLLLALAPFLIATVVGLIVLWPSGELDISKSGFRTDEFKASVADVTTGACPDVPGQENFVCAHVTVTLEEGPDSGDSIEFDYSAGPRTRLIEQGDSVIVGKADVPEQAVPAGQPEPPPYFFLDFDRRMPLIWLGIVFSIVVIALSRWRGLAALAGLAVSLLVLTKFVLPAILSGSDPLAVAIVGGAVIMFLALYLAHGFNAATTTAVLGTLAALFLTGLLAWFFVNISFFTGAGSEEAAFLQISQQQVNLQGLLLASIIIGTLGVLDDVTVTQASAVWELHKANPEYGGRNLYRAAIRIGRDHIASTVNTLVLAYAGAALPLLILFSVSDRALGQVLNTEMVAEEIVRTLVGSIGLIASVPITTGLAVLVVNSGGKSPPPTKRRKPKPEPKPEPKEEVVDYTAPLGDRDFWAKD
ncbi:MAG: hypothetical protein QOG04_1019 [Actinomycetota bacterium]|jgi:uncharacterized membrane protein|nr:hypothetical protein [Actinomycetota bacterium]